MNSVPQKSNEAVGLVSDTMPVSFSDMLEPVTRFLKDGDGARAANSHHNGKPFGALNTPSLRRNDTHQFGVVSLSSVVEPRRPAAGDRGFSQTVAGLSEVPVDFSSQIASHGYGMLSRTEAFPQTLGSYDAAETHPFLQASDMNSPGRGHSGLSRDDLFSELSVPSGYGRNGGNSHFSADTGFTAQGDHALDGWKDLSEIESWNDISLSPSLSQLGEISRFGVDTRFPHSYFGGGNNPMQAPDQATSLGSSGFHVTERRGHPGRPKKCVSINRDDFCRPFQSSGLNLADPIGYGQRREVLVGKRKRMDGGPQDVLEGIFIVTRRPKNGQTKSIADLIGWTFQEVNGWFERRVLWEKSHTSSTSSQSVDMLLTSSTINLSLPDSGDSGYFELPSTLTDVVVPRKRLKRHPSSGTKIKEAGEHGEEQEAKTYPCIHEKCAYSTDKFGEWKRHMASVHFPGRWACLMQEENQIVPTDNACSSCGNAFDSVRDLKEHIHLSPSCPDTLALVRVFDRKDKLVPHWERWHELDTRYRPLGDEALCERAIGGFDEKCGFCKQSFANWDKKMEHVGNHFKDEGRKISTWRYLHCDDRHPILKRPVNKKPGLHGDLFPDSDADTSDSDDSDDDDMGDRTKKRTQNRRDDRDRDKGGNSGSGGTSRPPPDNDGRDSGDSSSKNSKGHTKYAKGSYARQDDNSVQDMEHEAGDNTSLTWNPCWCPQPELLLSSGAVPPHQDIRTLGHGGFGAVSAIRLEGTNQVVARKRIRRYRFQNKETARELEMIRKLQGLDHPHIVRFLGSYTTDTHIDILMLPVADCDLSDFMIQQQHPVPAAVKRQMGGFCSCLASALEYIHERDIRHLDIKPKNILVANGRVLIADFGSASDTYHQAANEFVGVTPKYTAPEVFKGGCRGRPADVWSLGCVLMELITVIHDKTLFEFELSRSYNTGLRTAQPFHRTIGKMIGWLGGLKALPKVGAALSLEWQGVSYLDTIAEMLQEDQRKRPTASDLLRRFSPSPCCSNKMRDAESLLSLYQPGLVNPTLMDRISEAAVHSWASRWHHLLPDTKRHTVNLIELSEFYIENSNPPTSIHKMKRDQSKTASSMWKVAETYILLFCSLGAETQNMACITAKIGDKCGGGTENTATSKILKIGLSQLGSSAIDNAMPAVKCASGQPVERPAVLISPPDWEWGVLYEVVSSEWNCCKLIAKHQETDQASKVTEDLIQGRSVLSWNGEERRVVRQGRGRCFSNERREEIAAVRKRGVCISCRVRKVKV